MITQEMCLVIDHTIISSLRRFIVCFVRDVPIDTYIYILHEIIENVDRLEALFTFSHYEYNTKIAERATL